MLKVLCTSQNIQLVASRTHPCCTYYNHNITKGKERRTDALALVSLAHKESFSIGVKPGARSYYSAKRCLKHSESTARYHVEAHLHEDDGSTATVCERRQPGQQLPPPCVYQAQEKGI